MRTVNSYILYKEENRYNGCVCVEYTAIAYDEENVREMAEKKGVDLRGYTIECIRHDSRNELHKPYEPEFKEE